MNTQLASWTELRHDNLLYAKQSYTGGGTCSFPRTYVEPVPDFYRALAEFASEAAVAFSVLPAGLDIAGYIPPFFQNMQRTMGKLAVIADKELSGTPFSAEEVEFLADVLYFDEGCEGTEHTGWYRDLFFSWDGTSPGKEDLLIADVHTQPTDAEGAMVGHVLHVATGSPEIGVFVAVPPGLPPTAFAGPVAAYHEYVTMNFERLTDEEWQALYAAHPPTRPDWTFVYLADENGDVRDGPRLVEDVTPIDGDQSPQGGSLSSPQIYLAPNRPNPFNPSTVIAFRIAGSASRETTLRVFDVGGREVATLLDERLTPGAYLVRWDGRNERGIELESATYVVELRSGQHTLTQKAVVVR
jgi:hypothetical protein